ncbi:MAG TPA: benzoate/H(+) symporter BenE family transporter [Xanthobacteraceae bacterium]|nr:benzoate/H(+) symporter BenE family transporter [Xanthobacteraceae bacterium]
MQACEIREIEGPGDRSAAVGLGRWTMSYLHDFNMPAFWAGITGFVWYAFGAVPLQIAVAGQLGLTTDQSSSWMFIIWFSGAVASIALSLCYRQPIPITWTIPGLVYLGTLAGQYSVAEMVGANLIAGVLIIALGVMGVGARIMAWLPLPIVMGMFAGSILDYVTRLVSATVSDIAVAGTTAGAFLLGRAIRSPRVPPLGLAMIAGGIAVYVTDASVNAPIQWALPAIGVPEITFSMSAVIAITLPMLILAMGLGNVQGIGFLMAQGYRVPVNPSTVVVGVTSVVNALFGGHPATVARTGVAIFAAPDAGPQSCRYWASLVAASLTVLLAVAATPVMSLMGVLPRSYVFALAGLAVLSALQDAFEKAFGGRLRFAALTAFAVAATPFSIAGIASASWAIIVGMLAALVVERAELLAYWRGRSRHEPSIAA